VKNLLALAIFIFCSVSNYTIAQSLSVLCSFNGTNGANPAASLVQLPNGLLYGTTQNGGTYGHGTMFQLTSTGGLTSRGAFNVDGASPASPVASLLPIDSATFYTTSSSGGPTNSTYPTGPGLLFKITTNGTMTILATFGTQSSHPHSAPVRGPDNNFYGTTRSGNANSDGVVYQFTTNGILNILYAFGANGYSGYNDGLVTPLVVGTDGKLYGTASGSGTNNLGWVFSITTDGQFTKLASFNNTNGANPMAPLIQAGDGNFYGTTANGGASNLGTVFKMTAGGQITTLASFAGTNGANPQAALLLANDGYFYGTTYSGGPSNLGTIFQITPNGIITSLVSFAGTNGANPSASLIQAQDGRLYGTTYFGGDSSNGVAFSIRLPPPLRITLSGGWPLVLWPSSLTNYVLQSTTNLESNVWSPAPLPNWSTVINGISMTGLLITNYYNFPAMFFRLF
jgi:uncharacterized repeat protein (TIGR03803 family)